MKHPSLGLIPLLMLALPALVLLAACAPGAGSGPSTWIDRPLDGDQVAMEPLTIEGHASDVDGVSHLEFFVDDTPIGAVPTDGSRFVEGKAGWSPTTPGVHTIRVEGVDSQGNRGASVTARIVVTGLTATVIPPPTAVVETPQLLTAIPPATLVIETPQLAIMSTRAISTLAPTRKPVVTTTAQPTATLGPTAIPKPNVYIVIAQLNLWYFGPGCYGGFEAYDCSGKRTTPFEPMLGHTYESSDPQVIQQQISWAADYGVDAFSLEWTTPRGIGNSLEDNIDDAFLKAPNLNRIRWCIFYDTALRIMQDPTLSFANGANFDDPKIYDAFVSDFDHFAAKYFNQPQYLKIDGRPVINIYISWQFTGNFQGAIRDARAKAAARGFDVYIVGEEMRGDQFLPKHIQYFDATTSFNFATPGVPDQPDMGKEAVVLDQFFKKWKDEIKDIKVFGRKETVGLEPSFGPQEDSRLFAPPSNQIYVPALSKDQVTAIAQVARDDAVPVGSLNQKLIWVNTWNGWAEGTTIEPTIAQGPKYPAGNYGFDFLEVIRDVFGGENLQR